MAERILLVTDEIWKPISWAPNYDVSNFGQVRTWKKKGGQGSIAKHPRLLKQKLGKKGKGYLEVHLRGVELNYPRVSRLVAEAFIPNPEGKETVNHKNGNKLDNHVNNLEWNTQQENVVHAFETGLRTPPKGEALGRATKLTEAEVREIRRRYTCECVARYGRKRNNCRHGNTTGQLGKEFGVSSYNIELIVHRVTWAHVV